MAFDHQEDLPDDINPREYFKKFWLDELTDIVVEQANLYSIQKTGQSVNTNHNEVEQLIGMNMKMEIVHLPSYILYWSTQLRYSAIADVMPLKRFEKLRRFLHFVDNMSYNQAEDDKLFKIIPIIEGNYNITHTEYFILCLDNFTINSTVPISRYFTQKKTLARVEIKKDFGMSRDKHRCSIYVTFLGYFCLFSCQKAVPEGNTRRKPFCG